MVSADLPIRRIRFELDGLLRTRPFVARAIQGGLCPEEYAELLGQLVALVASVDRESALSLAELALDDANRIGGEEATNVVLAAPCFSVRLFRAAVVAGTRSLPESAALATSLAVLSTSWLIDAGDALEQRWPGSTQFLDAVGTRSERYVARVEEWVQSHEMLASPLYALAELTRGTILGLATHLEIQCPPPVVQLGVSTGGSRSSSAMQTRERARGRSK